LNNQASLSQIVLHICPQNANLKVGCERRLPSWTKILFRFIVRWFVAPGAFPLADRQGNREKKKLNKGKKRREKNPPDIYQKLAGEESGAGFRVEMAF